jgi:hypothetical protein
MITLMAFSVNLSNIAYPSPTQATLDMLILARLFGLALFQ